MTRAGWPGISVSFLYVRFCLKGGFRLMGEPNLVSTSLDQHHTLDDFHLLSSVSERRRAEVAWLKRHCDREFCFFSLRTRDCPGLCGLRILCLSFGGGQPREVGRLKPATRKRGNEREQPSRQRPWGRLIGDQVQGDETGKCSNRGRWRNSCCSMEFLLFNCRQGRA